MEHAGGGVGQKDLFDLFLLAERLLENEDAGKGSMFGLTCACTSLLDKFTAYPKASGHFFSAPICITRIIYMPDCTPHAPYALTATEILLCSLAMCPTPLPSNAQVLICTNSCTSKHAQASRQGGRCCSRHVVREEHPVHLEHRCSVVTAGVVTPLHTATQRKAEAAGHNALVLTPARMLPGCAQQVQAAHSRLKLYASNNLGPNSKTHQPQMLPATEGETEEGTGEYRAQGGACRARHAQREESDPPGMQAPSCIAGNHMKAHHQRQNTQ